MISFFFFFKIFNFFLHNSVPYSILIKNLKRFLKSVHNFLRAKRAKTPKIRAENPQMCVVLLVFGCIYNIYIRILAYFLGVFACFARENTQKPDKKTTKTQPNSGMHYASCFGCSNQAGRDKVCKLLWYA